ncbi:MAG: cytochrome c3 family protein [Pirellula sp.]
MAITGKQRSRRIDRGYTAGIDSSVVWKRRLAWAGLLLGLAYGLWLLSPSGAKQMSTGELSKAHHAWNETGCENCHAPLSPIKTTSFGSRGAIAENNNRCRECHKGLEDHYPASMKKEALAIESCVRCHHEHLGFNHDLNDIADENCVRCHKDLSQVAVPDPNRTFSQVTSFEKQSNGAGHPDFTALATDPGTIQFSHIQHLRPGQPNEPNGRVAKSFDSLSPLYREQYQARKDLNGLIQLDCSDCHMRNNDQGLYQPIEFSKHCQACHELEVPHKLDFKDTKHLTDAIYASQAAALSRISRNQRTEPEPIGVLAEKTQKTASGQGLIHLIETDVPTAKNEIFKAYGCGKCHAPSIDRPTDPPSAEIVLPSSIKTQWLKDATFTHVAHANIDCNRCHNIERSSSAKPTDAEPPSGGNAKQVIIGGFDNCNSCHILDESQRRDAEARGNRNVARANCIKCHKYHHDPAAFTQPQAIHGALGILP